MFIVGELLTHVWSREGMHDALWLAYIATFIKQWGLTSATGFMWALVPEDHRVWRIKIRQTQCRHYQCHYGTLLQDRLHHRRRYPAVAAGGVWI